MTDATLFRYTAASGSDYLRDHRMKNTMALKKSRRTSARLHSSLFEINPLEQRLLMSSGQLFVSVAGSGPSGSVAEYTGAGAAVNASLISSVTNPVAVAVSGANLFVVNNSDTVSEYTTTGTLVNASLIQLPEADGIAISGNDIFVSDSTTNEIGEYTTSGATVNADLISDGNQPQALAISGSHLFVVDSATSSIGEYTLSGQTVNSDLINAGSDPTGLATSGSDLFVADGVAGTVGEYTTSGTTVNASLISGLSSPRSISIYGSNLYLADVGTNDIGQYTTAGATVNAALISGLASPLGVFAVGPASQLVVHAAPTSATAGTAFSPALVIHAEDANGNVDSLENSNVTVAIASGPTGGVLGGTPTVALQNGTATFSDLTLSKTGTYTLTATDGSFTAATTASITVTAGAADVLVFGQPPTAATVGAAITPAVTVDVEDAEGNLVTTYTSALQIEIATGPTGAVLGGTTSVAALGGVATFGNLTLSTAGTYQLACGGGPPAVVSGSFTISAPAPNILAFAQEPVSTTTTSVLPPVKVDVENSSGTLLTGDTSNVTLAIASGPTGATLGGTATVAAAGGIATFSNLTLTTAGTYTLTATDGSDTAVTSTSFTISVPGANKLAFAAQPQGTTTSTTLAAVKVNVENSSGVLLTGDTSTVTLAIASGPTGAALGGTASQAAVGGIATFSNLSFATAGTYTLTATDGSDTAVTSTSFTISVPGANKLAFAAQPQSATTSATLAAVKVNVENSSGVLLTGDTSTVTLAIASGPAGAVLGGTASVAAVAGVATFSNLSFATVGTYTLTATDGADTAATSTSFTISVPGTNKLAFATQPQSATTSATLAAVKVNVENSSGVLLTGDASTVTLAIASGPAGAVLGGTASVTAAGGVATFSNLSFAAAGEYTLIATDGTDTSVTSLTFTISPPLANKLAFVTEPASASTTTGLGTIKIDVENNAGTLLTSDDSDVTLSIATGTAGATLSGTTTVAAVNGVATFSNLSIATAGTNYTLTASDGSDVPANSSVFSITAPPVTNSLVFAGDPVNTNTASTLGSVTVDIENSAGAVVTTDTGNVTISITGNPAGVVLGGTTTVAVIDGVATFPNLTVNTIGGYTLTATEAGDTAAVSTLFNVYYPPVTVGQLDPTYGSAGLVKSNVGFTSIAGEANDNGQIVAIGSTGTVPTESFSIARYNANGTLDTTFGTSGVATVHFTGTDDVPAAVSVLPGGQILVAGTATTYVAGSPTTSQFAITEFNASGTLDTSFGNGTGEVLFGFSSAATHDVLTAMVVSPKGVIYLGGRSDSRSTTGNDFAIVALNPAGPADASFGAGGELLVDFDNASDTINSLALQTNGDLVAAGSATVGGEVEIALARVLPTGVLDRHFGTGGQVTTSVGGIFDSATSVAIQHNGEIVIGGLGAAVTADSSTTNFVVARYTSAGRLDRSFGSGGAVVTAFSGPSAVTQVLIQANGRIIAVGQIAGSLANIVSNQTEVALARYTTRGVLDTAFDASGTAVVNPTSATFTTSATPPVGSATLATEADELIASKQGSAVLNAGSEILAIGNSDTATVEAEVITQGVDLAAAVVTQLPTSIAGGTKSFANVQITENAPDTATGTVTITLELTTDAQGNGATVVKTLTQRINLLGGRNRIYKIPFVYPANLPTGNYYLLANVAGNNTGPMRELNQLNNLSAAGHTVTITPPFITLAGSALSATSTFTVGKTARIEFTLANNGNVLARGRTVVDLYLSTDQSAADGTLVSDKPFAIALQPGANHLYRLSFVLPKNLAKGTYTLIAVVDPLKSLGSIDQTSSTAVDPSRLIIG
jgi:uncharacterized delta-60 repeat protein